MELGVRSVTGYVPWRPAIPSRVATSSAYTGCSVASSSGCGGACSSGSPPAAARGLAGARAEPGSSSPWCLALGQLAALGAWRRRRQAGRTGLRAAIDAAGRRWETSVSRLGPPIPPLPADSDLSERWAVGAGELRVACHDVHPITALAWHQETICFGTTGGLVRTVDLESGSVVGDYYLGSHLPPSPVTALRFDGTAVVAGDEKGNLRVWRALLPGSWGFAHSPDWVMSAEGEGGERPAHGAAVTGLACAGSGSVLVSSDAAGVVIFWEPLGSDTKQVRPSHRVDLRRPASAICADPQRGEGVYAGLETGELLWLPADGGAKEKLAHFQDAGITALEWDAGAQALLLGLDDGRIQRWHPGAPDVREDFDAFHLEGRAVRRLSVAAPPASSGAGAPGAARMASAGDDGRVGVWDLTTRKPLWGFGKLSADRLIALADHSRLICNGLVINAVAEYERPEERSFSQSWKDPLPTCGDAPTCEAVLCLDLLAGDRSSAELSQEEVYWPSAMLKEFNLQ